MAISFNSQCAACLSDFPLKVVDGGSTGWSAYKCAACGLVQTHPMPSDAYLRDYYQGFDFVKSGEADIVAHVEAISKSIRFFAREPEGSGRFLDYGGGSGIYCKAAAVLNWRAELFDLDQNMLSFARNRLGVQLTWNDLAQISQRTYEMIFAYHVIEHWNGIEEPFRRLLELLEPGGSIIFATPNARSVEKFARPNHAGNYLRKLTAMGMAETGARQLLGKVDSILCWDPPRHLFAFTPDSLRAIGNRFGLETRIFIGYNTSKRYEPRRYVFPGLLTQLRQAWAGGGSRKQQSWESAKTFLRYLQMIVFRILYPSGGEQLYVRYRRA